MNRIFKIIFNKTLGQYTAVSELARTAGKKQQTSIIKKIVPVLGIGTLLMTAIPSFAFNFWDKYRADNDTALTTTKDSYLPDSDSETGETSLTIEQKNAADVRTIVAHPIGSSAYLPGVTNYPNPGVILYEQERGSNVFVGKMNITDSKYYTITATYDKENKKWNFSSVDEKGNPATNVGRMLNLSSSVDELEDVKYSVGKIDKTEQGYFQTNTVTKTGQVTGEEDKVSTTTRTGDVVKASTSKDEKTLTISVNGESTTFTDNDTVTSVSASEASKGYLTVGEPTGEGTKDSPLNYEVGLTKEATDALELAKKSDYQLVPEEISEEDKAAGVVSKKTLKDNGGSGTSHGEFVDTDTKYRLGQNVDEENNQTKISLINANNNDEVASATIKGDSSVEIKNKDGIAEISVKGTDYKTDDGETTNVRPGDALGIKGGSNITTSVSKNEDGTTDIKVGLKEDIDVKKVNASDSVNVGNTSVKSEGITIKRDNGSSVIFTNNEINMGGQQVHGVKAGTEDTDAVNFAQLKATEANFNQKLGNMDKHINRVEDNAYAGVAMALATAGLPQAWQPGKSMIAAAAGTYMGEQGYAIGFSHNTENGKWTLKATASGNSQGHFGGTVGAGYMW